MVNSEDIRTVISMVFSSVWICITGREKPSCKSPKPSPIKSIFEVRHYGLTRRQKCKPVCTICKKGFRSWKEQAEHWKHKHADKDEYKCKQCGKEFSSASNYKKTCTSSPRRERKLFVKIVAKGFHTHLS